MKVKAYAKVNLALNVLGKRDDGFHELEMIMAPIYLHDLVIVEPIHQGIEIQSNNRMIPLDERNIVYKAAKLMMERFNIEVGVRIQLFKHIPMQAGLAGGSADGAAVFKAMNDIFRLGLSLEELADLSVEVGSDLPFCMYNQFALVEGRGEKIETFAVKNNDYILLVKPRRGVSTKLAYGTLDLQNCDHPDCKTMKEALITGDDKGVVASLGNSLEQPAMALVPEIKRIKEELMALGFDGALMSGSGSCVFGLTKDADVFYRGFQEMKKKYPFVLRTRFKNAEEV